MPGNQRQTVGQALRQGVKRLSDAQIANAAWEARRLLAHLLGRDTHQLLLMSDDTLTDAQQRLLDQALERRALHYPLQYLLGEWDFYGLTFTVREGVLIPRPETELLVETVIDHLKQVGGATLLDLCRGTGCLAITLQQYDPGLSVWAVEKEVDAFAVLEQNIRRHQSRVIPVKGDILQFSSPAFECLPMADIIVCNPPYIPPEEWGLISPEVAYEPVEALLCGGDGLDFYRALASGWRLRLNRGGLLAGEIGFCQRMAVCALLEQAGWRDVRCRQDAAGRDRVVTGRWIP